MALTAPALLDAAHQVEGFTCTNHPLAQWLKGHARKNHDNRASRVYVVCDGARVVGFYALASGSIALANVPTAKLRQNTPHPMPAVVLGRLAVDVNYQRQGIGSGMLKDAIQRSIRVSMEVGARVLLCHATDESVKAFYQHHGFVESLTDPLTVMLNISKLKPDAPPA